METFTVEKFCQLCLLILANIQFVQIWKRDKFNIYVAS